MAHRITIIGGGPGGYVAAFAAAKAGAEVTLVESAKLGGTCLNWGCIPTKTFKASADALETVHRMAEFGLTGTADAQANMANIVARKNKVSQVLCGGIEKACAKLKINVIYGRAQVVNAGLVKVTTQDGAVTEVPGDKVIIATGSVPLNLPSLPVDHKHILSSDDALELNHVPKTLLIVGGGVIGCEMAFIFQAFGAKVTLVEGLDRVLPIPSVDEDMSKLLQREMKKRGINVELCRTVNKIVIEDGVVKATTGPSPFLSQVPASAQSELVVEAEMVFSTVGRSPNTEGLGLEQAGIATDKRGWIEANEYLETNVPGIYAIGDVIGPAKIMLAHMASAEGLVAVKNCLGQREAVDYKVCPSAIFTSPEIGTVGLTEAQAKAQGFDVECSQFNFRELGKAQAMGELPGVFKLIVNKADKKLLGVHIAGSHATDLIAEATLALQLGASAHDIANTIHAHPTLAEGMYEAAHMIS